MFVMLAYCIWCSLSVIFDATDNVGTLSSASCCMCGAQRSVFGDIRSAVVGTWRPSTRQAALHRGPRYQSPRTLIARTIVLAAQRAAAGLTLICV